MQGPNWVSQDFCTKNLDLELKSLSTLMAASLITALKKL